MTLKDKLEAVWRSHRIACPCHLVAWSLEPRGWKFIVYNFRSCYGLYYMKGKLVQLSRRRKAS